MEKGNRFNRLKDLLRKKETPAIAVVAHPEEAAALTKDPTAPQEIWVAKSNAEATAVTSTDTTLTADLPGLPKEPQEKLRTFHEVENTDIVHTADKHASVEQIVRFLKDGTPTDVPLSQNSMPPLKTVFARGFSGD